MPMAKLYSAAMAQDGASTKRGRTARLVLSQYFYRLRTVSRQLWVRAALISALAIVAAALGIVSVLLFGAEGVWIILGGVAGLAFGIAVVALRIRAVVALSVALGTVTKSVLPMERRLRYKDR